MQSYSFISKKDVRSSFLTNLFCLISWNLRKKTLSLPISIKKCNLWQTKEHSREASTLSVRNYSQRLSQHPFTGRRPTTTMRRPCFSPLSRCRLNTPVACRIPSRACLQRSISRISARSSQHRHPKLSTKSTASD